MPARSVLPDVLTLLRMSNSGGPGGQPMTDAEIASVLGVSRQAVNKKLAPHRLGQTVKFEWPWDVQSRHKVGWFYLALTYYVITRSKERQLTKAEVEKLDNFMTMVERMEAAAKHELVVDYYPETAGGWRLRRRRDTDTPGSLLGTPVHQAAASGT